MSDESDAAVVVAEILERLAKQIRDGSFTVVGAEQSQGVTVMPVPFDAESLGYAPNGKFSLLLTYERKEP